MESKVSSHSGPSCLSRKILESLTLAALFTIMNGLCMVCGLDISHDTIRLQREEYRTGHRREFWRGDRQQRAMTHTLQCSSLRRKNSCASMNLAYPNDMNFIPATSFSTASNFGISGSMISSSFFHTFLLAATAATNDSRLNSVPK